MHRMTFIAALITASIWHCAHNPFGEPDYDALAGNQQFSVFYNEPGADRDTGIDKKIDSELVSLIDNARESVYLAVYGFSEPTVVDAVIRAEKRNVDVRMVGDIDEFNTYGYHQMYIHNIDMSLGNSSGIQHNKFAVIDGNILFTGTGNITENGFLRNNNHFFIIEDKELADYYTAEFLQMYNGLFASVKRPFSAQNSFSINGNRVEVYYSPYHGEQAMNRLVDLVDNAQKSIHYMIFAYTHDELDAAMVRAARNRNVPVYGIHDSTFVTGVSEEAPRLYSSSINKDNSIHSSGPHLRVDGNENTRIKNNPSSGGKMHCKTLLIDAGTGDAKVATGSFNWSDNAISNNDENLMVIDDASVANIIYEQWQKAWDTGSAMNQRLTSRGNVYNPTTKENRLILSEINWAGAKDNTTCSTCNVDSNSDFIEIYNPNSYAVDISHWALQWGADYKQNIYMIPDSSNWYYQVKKDCGNGILQQNIVCPGEYVIIYGDSGSVFSSTDVYNRSTSPHFQVSGTKNFELDSFNFKVRLYDKTMQLVDEAGDGLRPWSGAEVDLKGYCVEDHSYTTAAACAGATHTWDAPGYCSKEQYISKKQCEDNSGTFTETDNARYVFSMQRRGLGSGNIFSGALSGAWFSSRLRCDSSLFSGCSSHDIFTYATPGYYEILNDTDKNAEMVSIELASAEQARIKFDSIMNQCTGSSFVFSITATGGGGAPPVVEAVLDPESPDTVLLNATSGDFSDAATVFTITAGANCKDYTGSTVATDSVSLNGFDTTNSGKRATVHFFKAALTRTPDYLVLKVSEQGSVRGLQILQYNNMVPFIVYEFSELYVQTGEEIVVKFNQKDLPFREDIAHAAKRASPYCVSTGSSGLAADEGVLVLKYKDNGFQVPQTHDVLFYSRSDGDLSPQLMAGPLKLLYEEKTWPLPAIAPVDSYNDSDYQNYAVDISNLGTDTGEGIERIDASSIAKEAWQVASSLTEPDWSAVCP